MKINKNQIFKQAGQCKVNKLKSAGRVRKCDEKLW